MGAHKWLAAACLAALAWPCSKAADASDVNPCRAVVAQCRAGDQLVDVTYLLDLQNPSEEPADVLILPSVDVLDKVEGLEGDLVLARQDGRVRAVVPAGWHGRVTLQAKQRILRRPGQTGLAAEVPMPPALSRTIELDLPGRSVDVEVSPEALVRRLEGAGDTSRFRIVPLRGDVFTIRWTPALPPRPPAYSLTEVHRITEAPPEFRDAVALEFALGDSLPSAVWAQIPPDVAVLSIGTSADASWKVVDGTLQVRVPADFAGDRLTVTCALSGTTVASEGGAAHLLAVPLFGCPDAERHDGRVMIGGGPQELSFATLEGASQTVAERNGWRLACEFRSSGAKVVARIVPIEVPVHAVIQSYYDVSAFAVEGAHRVTVGDTLPAIAALDLLLPPGHFVRSVAAKVPVEWAQDGAKLHVKPTVPLSGGMALEMVTEWLTGDGRDLLLTPPALVGAASSDYVVGISAAPNIQLKTSGEAEAWRVAPGPLPAWVGRRTLAAEYRYRDPVVPVEVEILPVETEIAGTIQDHVTVLEDRVRRETLFLLEIGKRPAEELVVSLPAGLAVERVNGPLIEGWELSEDGTEMTVRFQQPVQGPHHFQLVSTQPATGERVTLTGIRLPAAPQLKGWVGISSDVSVAVRPVEDGRVNIGSIRADRAPEYLKAFENKLVYEFYGGDWQLDLLKEAVRPVYSAEALNVLSFRAGQAEASAFLKVNVEHGGVGELDFRLPANASGPQFTGPDVVASRQEGGLLRVRFKGKRTGALACRIDYSIAGSQSGAEVELEPVGLDGAREQTGVLLLTQARPDVEVKPGALPQALLPAEAEASYPAWGYRREQPALAAYTYRGADWKLPVVLTAHPLSEVLLSASIPLAKLDTLVESGKESVNHLRLYVSNTSRQFLTVDLAKLGPQARLIGTYVYGEPVKPFREGGTKLELPLFTSEKAARLGMSVLDITYSTAHGELEPLGRQSLAAPDLGLNVGQLEWTVRVPEGYRIAGVGGSMGKPVAGVRPAPSLAGLLVRPLARFAGSHWGWLVGIAVAAIACFAAYRLGAWMARTGAWRKVFSAAGSRLVLILVLITAICILAAMFMPALAKARGEARKTTQSSNLHNVGLAIAMYRGQRGGVFPPSLQTLLTEGYLGDPEILKWPGQELVYRPLGRDAPPTAAVAYYWPSTEGANVLFSDNVVQWVNLDAAGDLVNPRDGQLVARAPSPDELRRIAAAPAPQAFAGVKYKAEEMQQAMQMEAQMGAQAPVSAQRARQRQQIVAEDFLEAHDGELRLAFERYRADHKGALPRSWDEMAPYVPARPVLDALKAVAPSPDALRASGLGRAREAADLSSQRAHLHIVGVCITMYQRDHGGAFPASLNDLLTSGYVDDRSAFEWPGQELIYRPLDSKAPETAVVAYFWPPTGKGVNVVYNDNAVDWVSLDESGNLVNPRTGELIARGAELAKKAELPADKNQLAAARYNLGLAYLNRGDYDRAEGNFRRAVELNKDYAEAQQQIEQTDALRRATAQQRAPAGAPMGPPAAVPMGPTGKGGAAGGRAFVFGAAQTEDLKALEDRMAREESRLEAATKARAVAAATGEMTAETFESAFARAEAVAQAAPVAPVQPRPSKASLVKQVGGGRSIGALPITIDFPTPNTVSYQFVKPFLGRADATVSFRALSRGAALIIELTLALCALLGFALVRVARPTAAMGYAAAVLAAASIAYLALPSAVAALPAGTVLAMALCAGGEAIRRAVRRNPRIGMES